MRPVSTMSSTCPEQKGNKARRAAGLARGQGGPHGRPACIAGTKWTRGQGTEALWQAARRQKNVPDRAGERCRQGVRGGAGGCDPLVSEHARVAPRSVRGYRPRFGIAGVSSPAPLALGNGSRGHPPWLGPPPGRPWRRRAAASSPAPGGVGWERRRAAGHGGAVAFGVRGRGHRHVLPVNVMRGSSARAACSAGWAHRSASKSHTHAPPMPHPCPVQMSNPGACTHQEDVAARHPCAARHVDR